MLFVIERFVHSEVILANSSPIKLIFISLDENGVLLPVSSINVGFGAKALKENFHCSLVIKKICACATIVHAIL